MHPAHRSVLILGGTHFVGRHIVETLVSAGYSVSVLNRGRSSDELPIAVERLRGDRDLGEAGLESIAGRTWDACVDVSGYSPRQVRPAVERLLPRVGRYVYISAVSVYGDPSLRPVLETHPRLTPAPEHVVEVDGDTYGPLKVACEDIVMEAFGTRATLLRPQIVVGPHDQTNRYTFWVQRAAADGELQAPGDGSDHLQVIDVQDVARFVQTVLEHELPGPFNLAGPRLTWREFIDLLGAINPVWVPATELQAAGLTFVALPLFRPEQGPRASLMDVSPQKALDAGLILTSPAQTLERVRAWLRRSIAPPSG